MEEGRRRNAECAPRREVVGMGIGMSCGEEVRNTLLERLPMIKTYSEAPEAGTVCIIRCLPADSAGSELPP